MSEKKLALFVGIFTIGAIVIIGILHWSTMKGQASIMEKQASIMEEQASIMQEQTTILANQTANMQEQTTILANQAKILAEGLPDLSYQNICTPEEFTFGSEELLIVRIANPLHYSVGCKVEVSGTGILVGWPEPTDSSSSRTSDIAGLESDMFFFHLRVEDKYFDEEFLSQQEEDVIEFRILIYDTDKDLKLAGERYVYELQYKRILSYPDLAYLLEATYVLIDIEMF